MQYVCDALVYALSLSVQGCTVLHMNDLDFKRRVCVCFERNGTKYALMNFTREDRVGLQFSLHDKFQTTVWYVGKVEQILACESAPHDKCFVLVNLSECRIPVKTWTINDKPVILCRREEFMRSNFRKGMKMLVGGQETLEYVEVTDTNQTCKGWIIVLKGPKYAGPITIFSETSQTHMLVAMAHFYDHGFLYGRFLDDVL